MPRKKKSSVEPATGDDRQVIEQAVQLVRKVWKMGRDAGVAAEKTRVQRIFGGAPAPKKTKAAAPAKKKRKGYNPWAGLTPEAKAARIEKMKAGRKLVKQPPTIPADLRAEQEPNAVGLG